MKYIKTFECKLIKQSSGIDNLVSKLGGSPVLQENIEWPKCKACGRNMDFIGQISLNYPIKFSEEYTMAYIFMCPGEFENGLLKCENWDCRSGANIVILQSGGKALYSESAFDPFSDYLLEFEEKEEPWIDYTDYEIDEDIQELVVATTKIGGVTAWLQDDETPNCPKCGKSMKFVAQIESELEGPLSAFPEKWEEECKEFLNFGGWGMGFVFICDEQCGNKNGAFLWQCG